MTTIRPMVERDFDAVRQVHAEAFGAYWRQQGGEAATPPRRTRASVLASWERDPGGCFVAEEDASGLRTQRVVGCIFSRTWGSVGWFGALAVLPECQGRGIGQRLIAASLEYLRREPERVVGLETMPDSEYNLGLYLRHGFESRCLRFTLGKALEQPAGSSGEVQPWSQADASTQERWLGELREATGQIQPGLDYTKEIAVTVQHGLGEALVLVRGGWAVGFSVVRLASVREDGGEEVAGIQALALHPAHTNPETFQALLKASEGLARVQGKQWLAAPVSGRHTWALKHMLAWGYRVDYAMVRMVLEGTDAETGTDGYANLSAWAG